MVFPSYAHNKKVVQHKILCCTSTGKCNDTIIERNNLFRNRITSEMKKISCD